MYYFLFYEMCLVDTFIQFFLQNVICKFASITDHTN